MLKECEIEEWMLSLLEESGWHVASASDFEESRSLTDLVLESYFKNALYRLNPELQKFPDKLEELAKVVCKNCSHNLYENNYQFHKLLIDGVPIEYRDTDGGVRTIQAKLIDFEDIDCNEFIAVNQLSIIQKHKSSSVRKIPDVILFINGLPLVVCELKNPKSESVHLTPENSEEGSAFDQIQTYKTAISDLFRFNELCIISDGIEAKVGTISSPFERFGAWKTINGEQVNSNERPELETLVKGMLDPARLLDVIQNFVVFDSGIKKVASYHQYWAVNKALHSTVVSSQKNADHKAGVIWHTQGSGKSLSMLFYCGKLIQSKDFQNPTIVVITDRIDLDGQLFDTFSSCSDILRQTPKQAETRKHLRELLGKRQAGGVIFATLQKFSPLLENGETDTFPKLSDRTNIIVIADEAHRSQYGFDAKLKVSEETADVQMVYGNAKYLRDALPNASYIGWTGTPIELDDKSTKDVFGDYIDIYDIQRAVQDGATVPIYYESRLVNLGLDEDTKKWLDEETDGLFENADLSRSQKLKNDSTKKEAIVGNAKRLKLIAEDIINHFSKRSEGFEDGKALVVTMTRTIAAQLYNEIVAKYPNWKDKIKVVITGSSADSELLQPHIRNRPLLKEVEKEFKDSTSSLKIVIVCDMWLTGFDVPSLTTMYLDKPLRQHGLMQAIARVNRVYPGKDGGLVVDYLGVASALRDALNTYTVSGGQGVPTLNIEDAIDIMDSKLQSVREFMKDSNYKEFLSAKNTGDKLQIILSLMDFVLQKQTDSKKETSEQEYDSLVSSLTKAFNLCMPHNKAIEIREEVALYQIVKIRLAKLRSAGSASTKSDYEYKKQLKELVDKAIEPLGIVDVFEAAGLKKPKLSILSDEFLAQMKGNQKKSLALKALEALLKGELKRSFAKNKIKFQKFSELIEIALLQYKNESIEAAKVIEELIGIAKQMQNSQEQSQNSGLTEDEIAFYDALVENGSAKEVMEDEQLRNIAKVLVNQVRKNTSIDWQTSENAKAKLRIEVKKVLKKFGYPPDESIKAAARVIDQAELFAYAPNWRETENDSNGSQSNPNSDEV